MDASGKRMESIDWYVGIPPTRRAHVALKLRAIETAMRVLEPDGIHLGFMRSPGFWELWMPYHRSEDFPEYSYDRQTLELFQSHNGTSLRSLATIAAPSFPAC